MKKYMIYMIEVYLYLDIVLKVDDRMKEPTGAAKCIGAS